MPGPPPDPVMAFAELAAELVGRAVAATSADEPEAGSQDEEPAAQTVILELCQPASAPGDLVLKVTDEGVGLPLRARPLCRALAPLERALASPAVRDGALLLRTTGPSEAEVRRYQVMGLAGGGLDVVPAPPAPKPPGLRLSGTQAAVTFDSTLVPPAAAAEVCDQLLSMLCVLCPPVRVELKCHDLQLGPASQEGDTADSAAALQPPQPPAPAATSFTRLLAPSLSYFSSPLHRLRAGLLQEFQAPPPAAADAGSPPLLAPPPPPPLTFVAAGEAPLPRGCKWGACAGVVLQMPDHAALAAAGAGGGGPPSQPAAAAEEERPPAAAWIFADHALQMSSNGVAAGALARCDWAGHGFRLAAAAAPPPPGPLQLALRCAQPGSGASIPLVVVHMYPLRRQEGSGPGGPAASPLPPPPPRYESLLVRGAVDAALVELRQLCPAVIAGRRDRSLARALPVVASAAAAILRRAVDGAAAAQACAALGAGPNDLDDVLLQRLKEAVAAAEGAASQG